MVTFPALGKSRPRQGPRRRRQTSVREKDFLPYRKPLLSQIVTACIIEGRLAGGGRSPRRLETVNRARVQISTLKSNGVLPAAPSEVADSRPAPACSPPLQCPLRFSACAPGVQGDAPAALFPRFLSRKRNRAAGGTLLAGAPPHRHPSSGASRQLPPREARVLAPWRPVVRNVVSHPSSPPRGLPPPPRGGRWLRRLTEAGVG